MLLDDLLVAEDQAAAETTSAASHSATAASNVQAGRLGGRYGFADERTRQTNHEAVPDGAVVLGNPVAPPMNGDMYTDISTENAMFPGSRYGCGPILISSLCSAQDANALAIMTLEKLLNLVSLQETEQRC